MNIGELVYKITGDSKPLKREKDKADKEVKSLGNSFKKFSKIGIAAFAAVAIAGVGAITKELITTASQAEETRNKFNVVFADVKSEAVESARVISDSYGTSQQAAEKYLSQVGDIVKGLGATGEEALSAADEITRLGIDIDSFANLSGGAEQAVQALTSLFTGEREAAKALGIVINETNLKQYAEDTGKVFKELTPLEKGFLSLELAATQSELAIGDFARSQDSFANQTRIAKSNVEDLTTIFGQGLLPAATGGVRLFNNLTGAIKDFLEEAQQAKILEEVLANGVDTGGDLDAQLDAVNQKLNEQIERLQEINRQRESGERTRGSSGVRLRQAQEELALIQARKAEIEALLNSRQAETEAAQEAAERALRTAEIETQIAEAAVEASNNRLTDKEKEIKAIQDQIDALALLREEAKEYGVDYTAIQAEINALTADRQTLLEEGLEQERTVEDARKELREKAAEDEAEYWEKRERERQVDLERQRLVAEAEKKLEEQKLAAKESFFSGFLALTALGAEESKELFLLNKGLASAEAAINSYAAFSKTLVDGGPFPINTINAAGVLASGIAQQIKILGTSPPQFENGGIVPQRPGVPETGDNVLARVNPGELILNRAQQAALAGQMGGEQRLVVEFIPKGLFKLVNEGRRNGEIRS